MSDTDKMLAHLLQFARSRRLNREPLRGERVGHQLSAREIQVAVLLADGLCNKEIAQKIGTSYRTIEAQRRDIKHKLGVGSTAHIIRWVIRNGLIEP